MTAEQKLTELGFTVVLQSTINMTETEIHRQIESDSDIAAAVRNEVTLTHAPNPVTEKNYCFSLMLGFGRRQRQCIAIIPSGLWHRLK